MESGQASPGIRSFYSNGGKLQSWKCRKTDGGAEVCRLNAANSLWFEADYGLFRLTAEEPAAFINLRLPRSIW